MGVQLDDDARDACAAVSSRLSKTGYAARYEPPEKLHVTLAFLGYVEPLRLDEVRFALQAASQCASEFGVVLDKLGAFPHERKPRVVYIGAREQGAGFRRLAFEVRARYAALGFDFRDDAVVHVTI
ncbi:MAG: RNA 2',3'-cyclic phosphodiesterase, partial [Candidatus Eremiobacteraeota bacterium]|nr:RNA 2',3'-cyclic phosphodiesterase [Candidatus Eremiobacteraeota bacterium]